MWPSIAVIALALLSAVSANLQYTDSSGKTWSHFLVDGQVHIVNHEVKPMRNSELLAAGLHPRTPTSIARERLKRAPTRVDLTPRAQTSGTPSTNAGVIVVKDTSGNTLGFVDSLLTVFDTFPITTDKTEAAQVTLGGFGGVFNIAVAGEAAPDIGAVEGAAGDNFVGGSPSYAFMSPVSASTSPSTDNPIGSPGESDIWSLNTNTLELTAGWQNGDGSFSPLTIFHDVSFGDLDFTADEGAFTSTFGDSILTVQFFFLPNS